jgi:hypothetical protein
VGEKIQFLFRVQLTAFIASSLAPSTEDEKMALSGLYDLW